MGPSRAISCDRNCRGCSASSARRVWRWKNRPEGWPPTHCPRLTPACRPRAPARPRLSPWEIVQLARHPQRPKAPDFIFHLVRDFTELHGDRLFRDDPALLAGIGWFEDQPVAVIGPYKGRDTKENLGQNIGMPNP